MIFKRVASSKSLLSKLKFISLGKLYLNSSMTVSLKISIFLLFFSSANAFTLNGFQKGWKNSNLEINVNLENCPSDILDILNKAFNTWNSVPTSSLKLKLGQTTSSTSAKDLLDGNASDSPLVVCDSQFSATTDSNGDNIPGVGFAGNDGDNLAYGGLILNAETNKNASLDKLSDVQKTIVIAHELGHVLGLGHSSYAPALMYFAIGSKIDFNLSKDDWDGISYLYPRSEFFQPQLLAGCGQIDKGFNRNFNITFNKNYNNLSYLSAASSLNENMIWFFILFSIPLCVYVFLCEQTVSRE